MRKWVSLTPMARTALLEVEEIQHGPPAIFGMSVTGSAPSDIGVADG